MKPQELLKLAVTIGVLCGTPSLPGIVLGQGAASNIGVDHNRFVRSATRIPNRYVVVLNDSDLIRHGVSDPETDRAIREQVESTAAEIAIRYGANVERTYQFAIRGVSIKMSEEAAIALSHDPRVKYVEEDGEVSLAGEAQRSPPNWGIDRIDQRRGLNNAYDYNTGGEGVNVYVIDTGVRTTHHEFLNEDGTRSRARFAYDAVDPINGTGDPSGCGHGTLVAGVIGGRTYGVAKTVNIHSVRVFDNCRGGPVSTVIAGIDWVAGHHRNPAIANLSLNYHRSISTDPISGRSLNDAVQGCIGRGVTCVVSAGNYGQDAGEYPPADVVAAITVGATDDGDGRWISSNYGTSLDLFAPGDRIRSAYNTSDDADDTWSGTSFAAPHVAGVAALYAQREWRNWPVQDLPAAIHSLILDNATPGVVINAEEGSPNRMLYSRLSGYFLDHFDTGPTFIGWTFPIPFAYWSYDHRAMENAGPMAAKIRDLRVPNFEISTTLRMTDNGGSELNWMGLLGRTERLEDTYLDSGYLGFIRSNGEVVLYRKGAGELASMKTLIDPRKKDVRLTLRGIGTRISLLIDGVQYLSVDDAGYAEGFVGVQNLAAGRHDDVSVSRGIGRIAGFPGGASR